MAVVESMRVAVGRGRVLAPQKFVISGHYCPEARKQ
jgi:hypothetical protein